MTRELKTLETFARDSQITYQTGGGTTFSGQDAARLFAAMALESGLRLYARTGMKPNRMWTPTNMLAAATRITGKNYRRGHYAEAASDVGIWIEAMKAAIPISNERNA